MGFPIIGWAKMPTLRAVVSMSSGATETPVNSSFHVGLEPGDGRLFRFETGLNSLSSRDGRQLWRLIAY